ncbi:DMT family transporter [Marinobacter sp. JSM 1782161]|uniref:DMT family transporter n=1 Tax=Marinobacter sp. JSM 1782161 TaxID=2685906 RepID=UPI00140345CB|nr:DMT family transporter [Marinobacter sp. JSM 1782161]
MCHKRQYAGMLAGLVTVLLWSCLPVLRSFAHLPPMLIAAVAMICAAGLAHMASLHYVRKDTSRIREGRYWLMAVGGLAGALYFYFLALQNGDPARITLVTYTWPLGFVLIANRLAGQGLSLRLLLGSAIAFTGLAPLVLSGSEGQATSLIAYAAGLAAGICWIAFSVYLRQAGALSLHGYRSLFLHVSLVALAMHGLFEQLPEAATSRDWAVAGLIGLGPYGAAFISWGFALQRGPATLLGLMTYLVPVLAALLLVLLGWSPASYQLALAATAVVAGALLSQGMRIRPGTT